MRIDFGLCDLTLAAVSWQPPLTTVERVLEEDVAEQPLHRHCLRGIAKHQYSVLGLLDCLRLSWAIKDVARNPLVLIVRQVGHIVLPPDHRRDLFKRLDDGSPGLTIT